ncbi:hypothetical protein SUGI_0643010 [Cryptomeria japonica]|uniref:uncharacterized protein LOC131067999 n=1 Tax=Cryptomeria japonica TaxID=3369 RepID=UPI002414A865|nr:uncharacterized protein LOC131067999 [Cryptomeria japonica]GLJ31944.1 hypothetical protein SUGI_0643010 [Cryptomeria japonica]
MQMDELGGSKQEDQLCLPSTSDAALQQGMHILYRDTNGYVLSVERGTSASETHHKCDLESGIRVSEPEDSSFLASTRRFYGNVGGSLSFSQRVDRLIDGYACNSGVQYGVSCGCQQKEVKEGFLESAASDMKKEGFHDSVLMIAGNAISGSNENIRYGNDNGSLKPGWKKPPRPPRSSTDSARERHMKGNSDRALLRRARLERMKILKKQKVGKPSSTKTTLWALLFTVFFFAIVITQGIHSLRTVSPQDSSTKLAVSNFSELGQTLGLGNFSAPYPPLQNRGNTMIETTGRNKTNSSKR